MPDHLLGPLVAIELAEITLCLVGSAVAASTAAYVRRTQDAPGSSEFRQYCLALSVLLIVWGGVLVKSLFTDVDSRDTIGLAAGTLSTASATFWLLFTARYTGYGHLLSDRRYRLLLAPMALYTVALVFGVIDLIGPPVGQYQLTAAGIEVTPVRMQFTGVIELLAAFYIFIAIGAGAVLLTRTAIQYEHVEVVAPLALSTGALLTLLPFFGAMLTNYTDFPTIIDRLTFEMHAVVSAPVAAMAVRRLALFDVVPAVRTGGNNVIMNEIDDPTIIVDSNFEIVNMNSAAEALFQAELSEFVGTPITQQLGIEAGSIMRVESIKVDSPDGRQFFDVSVSEVSTADEQTVGYALVLTDITDQQLREQRLQVMNRLLRHNLRNELGVILGRADVLAQHESGSEHAELIGRKAEKLAQLSDKMRDASEVVETRPEPGENTPLQAAVESAINDVVAEFPDAVIETDIADIAAGADRQILERVLSELIDNACRHNDSEEPTVRIETVIEETRDRPITLSVIDNGPGIPDVEHEPILQGEETDLQHGTGIGLWLVKWGVTQLSGNIEFGSVSPHGTNVTIRLPRPTQTTALDRSTVSYDTAETDD